MKHIVLSFIIAASMLCSVPSCSSLTDTQRASITTVSNAVLTRYETSGKITPEDATVIRDGIRIALDPKATNKDKAVAAASAVLNALVSRGIVKQQDADVINLALVLGGTLIK